MAFKVVMYSHTFLLGAAGEQEENALERPLVDLRRRWIALPARRPDPARQQLTGIRRLTVPPLDASLYSPILDQEGREGNGQFRETCAGGHPPSTKSLEYC